MTTDGRIRRGRSRRSSEAKGPVHFVRDTPYSYLQKLRSRPAIASVINRWRSMHSRCKGFSGLCPSHIALAIWPRTISSKRRKCPPFTVGKYFEKFLTMRAADAQLSLSTVIGFLNPKGLVMVKILLVPQRFSRRVILTATLLRLPTHCDSGAQRYQAR